MNCVDTMAGARVKTSCLYPSFEPVHVFIIRFGEGFRVHDGGEAARVAFAHGRDGNIVTKLFNKEATRFGISYDSGNFSVTVETSDWLASAILSVANAAAVACSRAVETFQEVAQEDLIAIIYDELNNTGYRGRVIRDYERWGKSGRRYKFPVAIDAKDMVSVFSPVTPHANSVSSRFRSYSDVGSPDNLEKYLIFFEDLSPEDTALLQEVATVMSMIGLRRLASAERLGALH